MEETVINANLGILGQEDIVKTEKQESLCSYDFLCMYVDADAVRNPLSQNEHSGKVRLDIRKDYLLQVNPNGGAIVSGFQFDYSVKF